MRWRTLLTLKKRKFTVIGSVVGTGIHKGRAAWSKS